MSAKTERNITKSLVTAKLETFKKLLVQHQKSNDLYHRFLCDVLENILDEALHAMPLIYPLLNDFQPYLNEQNNEQELLVVINLINKIEDCLEADLRMHQDARRRELETGVELILLAVVGFLLTIAWHIITLYMTGKMIILAPILTVACIFGSVMALGLALTLAMALYFYIKEYRCALQLTKLCGPVNQSKSYELDDSIVVQNLQSFNYQTTLVFFNSIYKQEIFIDKNPPQHAYFKIQSPAVCLFFNKHQEGFETIASELRSANSQL